MFAVLYSWGTKSVA